MLAVVLLGVHLLALPAAADFGFRLPLSLVPDALQMDPDFGYLCPLFRTLLSFGLRGGRLWVWSTLRPDSCLLCFVCVWALSVNFELPRGFSS